MSHPIGFSIKAATAARRQRRPGGGPERSEGIAVSPKEIKRGAFFATRFSPFDHSGLSRLKFPTLRNGLRRRHVPTLKNRKCGIDVAPRKMMVHQSRAHGSRVPMTQDDNGLRGQRAHVQPPPIFVSWTRHRRIHTASPCEESAARLCSAECEFAVVVLSCCQGSIEKIEA